MADFLLWLDFETTGLDPADVTVLEVGWTVTDANLQQLTPLRSRITALPTGGTAVVPTNATTRGGGYGWAHGLQVEQVVRDMHKESKLYYDWLATPPFRVIDEVGDFDRLLLDDLWSAGWKGKDSVFLAGAGVSHYDRLVIDQLGALRLDEKPVLHYRAADISAAIQVMGVPAPKDAGALVELAGRCARLPGSEWTESALLKLDVDASCAALVSPNVPGDEWSLLNPKSLVDHRAASDVAYALVVARCLRALVRPLS